MRRFGVIFLRIDSEFLYCPNWQSGISAWITFKITKTRNKSDIGHLEQREFGWFERLCTEAIIFYLSFPKLTIRFRCVTFMTITNRKNKMLSQSKEFHSANKHNAKSYNSNSLPCSRRILSFRLTLRSPFFKIPMTMSYDRPGCACSAFVSAARSVCDATTSRLSNCDSIQNVTQHNISMPNAKFHIKLSLYAFFILKMNIYLILIIPVIKLVSKARAKLMLKLVFHRSLSWCQWIVLISESMEK